MGYQDALRDGIAVRKTSDGFDGYYPPCSICGTPVYSWSYISGTKYICNECRKEMVRQYRKDHIETAKDKKFSEAVKRIRKVADIDKYESAIKSVQKSLHHEGWFQSTEEIMTAIELMHCGCKVYPQVKVFDYKVDFVIPEMKVALEIDGELFHQKSKDKQAAIRDEIISDKLGGYEVIHIPASNINTNVTRLMPAIKAVIRNRKKSAH